MTAVIGHAKSYADQPAATRYLPARFPMTDKSQRRKAVNYELCQFSGERLPDAASSGLRSVVNFCAEIKNRATQASPIHR